MAFNDNVLRLNADGTCEAGPLTKYPIVTSSDSSITVTPVTDPVTGEINYNITTVDDNTTYTYAVTNDYDGDGIIEITVTATESDGSTSNSTITISETEQEGGQYFSGQPSIDAAGIVTFPTANDEGESAGTPITLDLSALISSPHPTFTGSGGITTVYDGVSNTWNIASTDKSSTLVDNGDGTYTYQAVDVTGAAIGAPVVISGGGGVDTTDNSISTDNTISITVSQNGDGSQTEDLELNICSKDITAQQYSLSFGTVSFNSTQPAAGTNYILYDTMNITIANPSTCNVDFILLTTQHSPMRRSHDNGEAIGVEFWDLTGIGILSHQYSGWKSPEVYNDHNIITVPPGGHTIPVSLYLYPDMSVTDDQFADGVGGVFTAIPVKSFGGFN